MVGRSLRERLVLLNMFMLASLSLGYVRPDPQPPGRREGPGGAGLYCPHCRRELEWRTDEETFLFCDEDGAIAEEDALPPLRPPGS